nr:MAG TPA: hypothetical protein [Bacteriophage sp.]
MNSVFMATCSRFKTSQQASFFVSVMMVNS